MAIGRKGPAFGRNPWRYPRADIQSPAVMVNAQADAQVRIGQVRNESRLRSPDMSASMQSEAGDQHRPPSTISPPPWQRHLAPRLSSARRGVCFGAPNVRCRRSSELHLYPQASERPGADICAGMSFRTLKPRLATVSRKRQIAPTPSEQRTAGRQLQARRLRLWQSNPYCACCGQLVSLDGRSAVGFEVDHMVRLDRGGPDTDANCQVLCAWRDEQGRKQGCHAAKTAEERRPGGPARR